MLPAETMASALPSATARTAATRLESGFARTASAGLSAISIVSVVTTSGSPCVSRPVGPKSVTSTPSAAASSAPSDHLVGRVVSSKRVDCDAGHATER